MTCSTSATTSCGSRTARTSRASPTALISLVAAALGACSDDPPCPETERTIDHGVYGQIVFRQLDAPDTPLYDVLVSVTQLGNPPTYRTRSNRDGLYELSLPSGASSYMICTDFAASPCSSFTLTTVVRMDLIAEEETAVFWEQNDFPDCP